MPSSMLDGMAESQSQSTLTDLLGRYVHAAHTARTAGDVLELTGQLTRDAGELRDTLAVELALGGVSYAEIGRRLKITRQAAHDAYAARVQTERRRRAGSSPVRDETRGDDDGMP